MRSYNPVRKGHGGQIRKAVQLLLQAKRPYIYTGGGVILGNASAELRSWPTCWAYPCTNTLMGLGAMPASDPQVPGHAGHARHLRSQHDDAELRRPAGRGRALRRPRDRQPKHFASVERKIIHVDIDPSSISKRVKVDIPIVGDVKDVLQELIAQIREAQARPDARRCRPGGARSTTGASATACLQEQHRRHQAAVRGREAVAADQGRDTYITSDVGQHQMWAAQFYRFDEPRRWINSGGLGTMGVGLPYAMGIKLAKPDVRRVLHHRRRLDPDVHPGAVTCLQYNTPVKIVSR
jgi:acetolactate synthase-1/2/3 large subunit